MNCQLLDDLNLSAYHIPAYLIFPYASHIIPSPYFLLYLNSPLKTKPLFILSTP